MKHQNPSSTTQAFYNKKLNTQIPKRDRVGSFRAVHRKDGASMGGLFSFALEPSNVSFGEGFEVAVRFLRVALLEKMKLL